MGRDAPAFLRGLPAPLVAGSEFRLLTPNYRLRSGTSLVRSAAVLDASLLHSIGGLARWGLVGLLGGLARWACQGREASA